MQLVCDIQTTQTAVLTNYAESINFRIQRAIQQIKYSGHIACSHNHNMLIRNIKSKSLLNPMKETMQQQISYLLHELKKQTYFIY